VDARYFSSSSLTERFIVPLGREKGGYLDLLGLPADASPAEIASRGKEFRSGIDLDFRSARKALREKLKSSEILREDFDAQVVELEKIKNNREAEANQLRSKFENLQAEHRRLANAGRQREDAAFGDLRTLLPGGLAEFWIKLDSPLPVKQAPDALADAVWKVWLEGQRDVQVEKALPSCCFDEADKASLADVMDLWHERALVRLMLADTFWRRLRFTNQSAWDELIQTWVNQVEPRFKPLDLELIGEPRPQIDFPTVATWPNLYVANLPSGVAEIDEATDGDESVSEEDFDAESFLEWMNSQAAGHAQGGLDMAAYARWKAQRDRDAGK